MGLGFISFFELLFFFTISSAGLYTTMSSPFLYGNDVMKTVVFLVLDDI